MRQAWEDIREIDLMAYADGLLEQDAARKAAVKTYLAANPAEADRVEAMIRDNRDIGELYAGELERPVPKRLQRVLHGSARRSQMPQAIAAGLVLAMLAAGGGWLVGQYDDDAAAVSGQLLHGVAEHHVSAASLPAVGTAASKAVNGALLSAASKSVSIEIPLPDLSMQGFDLAERERIIVAGREMIRLVYRSPETTMNLFVRLRQDGKTRSLRRAEADGISVYHWSVGFLSYALTTDSTEPEAERLAWMMHGAVENARLVDQPPSHVTDSADHGEAVAEDGTMESEQTDGPEPVPAQPRQFN